MQMSFRDVPSGAPPFVFMNIINDVISEFLHSTLSEVLD